MKKTISATILVTFLMVGCNTNKVLLKGTWEYVNENGEVSMMVIDDDMNWSADYCVQPFEDAIEWTCYEMSGVVKLKRNKYMKLIFGHHDKHEWIVYPIKELTEEKLILEKQSISGNTYTVEYQRK